jgi:hypothetical protein
MCFHVRDPELYFLEDPKRLDTPRVLVRTDLIYRYLTDSHVDNLTYAMSVMLERFEIRKSALDVRLFPITMPVGHDGLLRPSDLPVFTFVTL